MNTEIISVIDSISDMSKLDFLKQFFPDIVHEIYTFRGIDYTYLSSGSTRKVYVDPTFDHVIKVPYGSYGGIDSGNKHNAIEVYDYIARLHEDRKVPAVRTEYCGWDGKKLIIKQDFLIVMNTGRVKINPIFEKVFKPEFTTFNEIHGFQYGWNTKTQRLELYDIADGYMQLDSFIDWDFDSCFRYGKSGTKCFDYEKMCRKLDYKNKFIEHLKSCDLYDLIYEYNQRPWCNLKHQDGILVYVNSDDKGDNEFFVELCGTAIQFFDGKLDLIISSFMINYKFNINTIKWE